MACRRAAWRRAIEAYYALTVPAARLAGSDPDAGANAQGNFHVDLLNPNTLNVLAAGQTAGNVQLANLTVTQGQTVYLHVFGTRGQGDFTLQFTNLDQFTTPDDNTLFFPTGGDPSQVAVADLTGNGKLDVVVDYADQNYRQRPAEQRRRHLPGPPRVCRRRLRAGNPLASVVCRTTSARW